MWILPTCLSFLYLSSSFATADPSSSQPGPSSGSTVQSPELQPLISKANGFLSTGKFGEAVKAYSEAIEQSPTDYVLYYKRATAYYSLSKHHSALQDFDKVLDLTNFTFDKALLMKGRIHAKEGDWNNAKDMLKRYKARASGKDATEAGDLVFEVSEGETAAKKAKQSRKAGLYQACVEAATDALKTATHSVQLRQLRADCALEAGDVQQAVGDMIRTTHLTPPSTSQLLRIAQLSYFLLPPSTQAQSTLKKCLQLDPDSKPCAKLHRQLKAFDRSFDKIDKLREANDWRGVIKLLDSKSSDKPSFLSEFDTAFTSATTSLKLPSHLTPMKSSDRRRILLRSLCRAYTKTEQPKTGEKFCEEVLTFEGGESDVDGLVGKAEALMAREMWEEAVRVFEKAWEASGRADHDVAQRLQKAQRLLKQSRQKDYYKVLGVARDADERTIKKAYRKAAMKAHPDKGGSEAQMAAINEAYEVLSDPELRTRFDNGDDPNDPTSQAGGAGGNPFQHGGATFMFNGNPFQQFFGGGGGGGGSHGGFGPDGTFRFQQQSGQGFHFKSGGR